MRGEGRSRVKDDTHMWGLSNQVNGGATYHGGDRGGAGLGFCPRLLFSSTASGVPTTRQRVGAAWAVSVWGSGSGERPQKVIIVQTTSRTQPLGPPPLGWGSRQTPRVAAPRALPRPVRRGLLLFLRICSCLLGAQERLLGPLLHSPLGHAEGTAQRACETLCTFPR